MIKKATKAKAKKATKAEKVSKPDPGTGSGINDFVSAIFLEKVEKMGKLEKIGQRISGMANGLVYRELLRFCVVSTVVLVSVAVGSGLGGG